MVQTFEVTRGQKCDFPAKIGKVYTLLENIRILSYRTNCGVDDSCFNLLYLFFLWIPGISKHLMWSVIGGARGVMVIVVGNGHSDTSSNPGRDWLHFTYH